MSVLEKVYNYAFTIHFGSKSGLSLETGLYSTAPCTYSPTSCMGCLGWEQKQRNNLIKAYFFHKRVYLFRYTTALLLHRDEQENSINSQKPLTGDILMTMPASELDCILTALWKFLSSSSFVWCFWSDHLYKSYVEQVSWFRLGWCLNTTKTHGDPMAASPSTPPPPKLSSAPKPKGHSQTGSPLKKAYLQRRWLAQRWPEARPYWSPQGLFHKASYRGHAGSPNPYY